jgi:hypothetical protein
MQSENSDEEEAVSHTSSATDYMRLYVPKKKDDDLYSLTSSKLDRLNPKIEITDEALLENDSLFMQFFNLSIGRIGQPRAAPFFRLLPEEDTRTMAAFMRCLTPIAMHAVTSTSLRIGFIAQKYKYSEPWNLDILLNQNDMELTSAAAGLCGVFIREADKLNSTKQTQTRVDQIHTPTTLIQALLELDTAMSMYKTRQPVRNQNNQTIRFWQQ